MAALLHGGERAILVWYGIGAVATVAYCTFGARCPQCRKNLIGRLLAKPYNEELKKKFDCPRCGLDVGALEKAPVEPRSEQEARG